MKIPQFKLERYFAKYEFSARYLLCSSDCESLSIADLLALEPGAEDGLKRHWLGYTESQGAPSLRQEISRIYTTVTSEQVLVHAGAEEAIFLFMHAMLGPGNHAVVHWPGYQSLFDVAKSTGAEVSFWQGQPDQAWALDLDELKSMLKPNTRVIVINTPHNPTGWLMPHEMFDELNRLSQERGIFLFCDEVYRELEHNPASRLPAACDVNPNAVSLGVMSKSYGLAGLRIGWIATQNAEIYAKMAALKDYTTICNSAPSEYLSELALRHRQAIVDRNLGIIQSNLTLLDDFFSRHADLFGWLRPKAGPIAFPKLMRGDIDEFCDELVHESGVLLLPGTLYDEPGNHFRLGFARKNMPEALARLDEFLKAR